MTSTDGKTSLPVVKLKPKTGRRLDEGAPWAFANEVALDRRTKALDRGSVVRLVDGDRDLGVAAFNPESRIAIRLLDPEADAVIGRGWFEARLRAALALRETLYDTPFYRLIHAEGDGLPGLVIDRFGSVAVVQPNAAWVDRLEGDLIEALTAVTGVDTVVVNATSRVRKLEGLGERVEVARGWIDGPIPVVMNGATYLADVVSGQKTGLFFDQRPNHAFVAKLAKRARVLDVFAHVGGFGLAALAAGAGHVLAIDSSSPALAFADEGARLGGVGDRFETRKSDAFDALAALAGDGVLFDIVVLDPPAFAPSKQALANGLRAYERLARMAAPLVRPGGFLVLCSCSHAVEPGAFHRANAAGMGKAGRSGALIHSGRAGPDHPIHPGLPETSYLKAMVYRLT